jgi:hypothetical protein
MILKHPKAQGELSEVMILAALVKKGYIVLAPYGDNQRYDYVIDQNGVFSRVQVKTGRIKNGSIIFPVCSSAIHTKNGTRRAYHGEIEYFAVYCPDNEKCYLVPKEDVNTNTEASLRLEPTRNKQIKNVRMASLHLL